MEKLILIGAGGHSKSVADSIDSEKYFLCGFVDENKTGTHMGKPIFGSRIEDVEDYRSYRYFVSIGDIYAREQWYKQILALGLGTVNIIDSTALISQSAVLGTGNFVGKLAIINADAQVGDNNVINTKALIEHECTVGNHAHISTNATINGNVIVEDGAFLGSGSTVIGQKCVGRYAVVGAGSTVIRDVPEKSTVVGVPARVIKRGTDE